MWAVIFIPFIAFVLYWLIASKKPKKRQWLEVKAPLESGKRTLLEQNVAYYNGLNDKEQFRFETRVQEFLLNHNVYGIKTELEDLDYLLVASSAIIPIFQFDNWRYTNIREVLIYPDTFNHNFETEGAGRRILGMVGTGYMNGVMILSRKALRDGFSNTSDKRNTAIHEFVHLIDKMDGYIDGVPEILLKQSYCIPWVNLIREKIEEMRLRKGDINPYGATNEAEFFAVVSEYFFERPKLLKSKHPELYALLEKMFDKEMTKKNLFLKRNDISRNDPCPCGSGQKFKKCCG